MCTFFAVIGWLLLQVKLIALKVKATRGLCPPTKAAEKVLLFNTWQTPYIDKNK
jgi:hypothetical protein